MSAPERKKNAVREGDNDALKELERFAKEGQGRNTFFQDHAAGETVIDTSVLAEGALRQGGD